MLACLLPFLFALYFVVCLLACKLASLIDRLLGFFAHTISKKCFFFQDKPRETKFTSDKVNAVGNSGESATLNCTAEGTQLIFYQLYKDGVMLRNSTSGVYILNSVSVSDDGVYTCSPLNFLGDGPTRQLSFNVQGNGRLIITFLLSSLLA